MEKDIEVFKQWMEQKNMSHNTKESYLGDLTQFIKSLPNKRSSEITQSDINNYIQNLLRNGAEATTVNRKLSAIKTFFKCLVREGILTDSPATLIECSKHEQKLPVVIDTDDITRLVNSIENQRDKIIIELLFATGIRRFELVQLKISDINFKREFIKVMGKGSKERLVPIHPKLLNMIL